MGLKQLAVGEKNLVGELGLVLELDPVPCLMVKHCALQEHEFWHLFGFGVREFTMGDDSSDMGIQGMDTLIRELADIGEEFVPEMQVVVFSLYGAFMVVLIASKACQVSSDSLSLRDWRVYQSSLSNIIFSCFHPVFWSSASSVLM